MIRIASSLLAFASMASALAFAPSVSGLTDEKTDPASGIKIPAGFRDWKLISVAHEAGSLNDIRSILGNETATKAYRDGEPPFPDGTIIARLAWSYIPSEENNRAFGREQSFVAGSPTNVQFMVKDSRKFAATDGWGFAQFTDGKLVNEAVPKACFSCHEHVQSRDFVFTHYAP